jgi:hypothetical protein
LRHQLAHDGELEDGLLEGVEAGFGGEQGVEVFGEALPVGGEVGGVGALGERAEQGFDELACAAPASACSASSRSQRAISSSTFATMRCCSASGGLP